MEPMERSLVMRVVVVERPPGEIGVQMRFAGQLERDTGVVLVMVVVADPRLKLTVTVSLPVRATVQEEVAMEVQPVHEVRWEPV
jgi:hypothetical protein